MIIMMKKGVEMLDAIKKQQEAIGQRQIAIKKSAERLDKRSKELVAATERIETPYADKAFWKRLSVAGRRLALVAATSTLLAGSIYLVTDKFKQPEPPSRIEQIAELQAQVNLNQVSTLDILNHEEKMLPHGDNSVPPLEFIINRTEQPDRIRAEVHLKTLGDMLSIVNGFNYYAEQNNIDRDDPIAVVIAAQEFDKTRRGEGYLNEGMTEPLRPQEVSNLFSRLEEMGNNRRFDQETIDYKDGYDKLFAPTP